MGKRILVLVAAAYGDRMSSPGIRAHHMARVLAERVPGASVTLAVPAESLQGTVQNAPCRFVTYTKRSIVREIANHDIIIATGFPAYSLFLFPWKTFVLDYFTQYLLEWMETSKETFNPLRRRAWLSEARKLLNIQLTYADFVLAANSRQRDAHIGAMMSLGLISSRAYEEDPTLRRLIGLAPHGVRPDPLEHTRDVVKGQYAGISKTDKLILWNGGIVNWYDPSTLIRAFAQVALERDDVKLLFLGASYPALGNLGMGHRFREAIELSRTLGLYNRNVFFDIGWVSYEEVKNYTLEADISVCTYSEGLETNFSLRTRFLDIFWAELPLICTRGDVFAGMVEESQLGLTVNEGDITGVANALRRLLDDQEFYQECRRNIGAIKHRLTWDMALEPLVEFCNSGSRVSKPKKERALPLASRILGYELARRLQPILRRAGLS